MTDQDDRRRALLGDAVRELAFDLGFAAPPPPPDVAARVAALLAAATVTTETAPTAA